jgi:hypothetical protein
LFVVGIFKISRDGPDFSGVSIAPGSQGCLFTIDAIFICPPLSKTLFAINRGEVRVYSGLKLPVEVGPLRHVLEAALILNPIGPAEGIVTGGFRGGEAGSLTTHRA